MLNGPVMDLRLDCPAPRVTSSAANWQDATPLVLPPHAVDLWLLKLSALEPLSEHLTRLLAQDELARAQRLVHPKDRLRFQVYRGVLRHLLARYAGGLNPAHLTFTVAPRGKPALAAHPHLQFNLSHAADLLAISVSHQPVGVDVENLARSTDLLAVAARFFHPRETALLNATPPGEQPDLFYRWWTAKEALLKAWGVGLGHEGEPPDFSAWPGDRAAELRERDGSRWLLWPLPLPPDWKGALVADADVTAVNLRVST